MMKEWLGEIYKGMELTESQIEVYTDPRSGKSPTYRQRQDYLPKDHVPLVIDGREVAQIPVRDLLP